MFFVIYLLNVLVIWLHQRQKILARNVNLFVQRPLNAARGGRGKLQRLNKEEDWSNDKPLKFKESNFDAKIKSFKSIFSDIILITCIVSLYHKCHHHIYAPLPHPANADNNVENRQVLMSSFHTVTFNIVFYSKISYLPVPRYQHSSVSALRWAVMGKFMWLVWGQRKIQIGKRRIQMCKGRFRWAD